MASGATLQSILDASSYYLGENGTPSSEVAKRTQFANSAKAGIRNQRHWSWELEDGDPINFVYSSSPTNGIYSYSLNPSAGAIKSRTAIFYLRFTDQNNKVTYFKPCSEGQMNYQTANGQTDNIYYIKGNDNDGYSLIINAGADALPTQNVSNGFFYRYFMREPDFVNTTDTTAIPRANIIAWKIAELVLFGYREQAQAQLAAQRYQDILAELAEADQKAQPFQDQKIQSFREAVGYSNNFKTYY